MRFLVFILGECVKHWSYCIDLLHYVITKSKLVTCQIKSRICLKNRQKLKKICPVCLYVYAAGSDKHCVAILLMLDYLVMYFVFQDYCILIGHSKGAVIFPLLVSRLAINIKQTEL